MRHLSEAGWVGLCSAGTEISSSAEGQEGLYWIRSVSWSLWSCTSCLAMEPEPGLHSDWWLGHRQGPWVTTLVPVSRRNAPESSGQGASLPDAPLVSSGAAVSNLGALRSDFAFLCLVSRKANALVQQTVQTCSWEHSSPTGTPRWAACCWHCPNAQQVACGKGFRGVLSAQSLI